MSLYLSRLCLSFSRLLRLYSWYLARLTAFCSSVRGLFLRLGLGMGRLVEVVGSVDGMKVGKKVSTVMAWKFDKFVKYLAYMKFIFFKYE